MSFDRLLKLYVGGLGALSRGRYTSLHQLKGGEWVRLYSGYKYSDFVQRILDRATLLGDEYEMRNSATGTQGRFSYFICTEEVAKAIDILTTEEENSVRFRQTQEESWTSCFPRPANPQD
jgi:hypothetical protein